MEVIALAIMSIVLLVVNIYIHRQQKDHRKLLYRNKPKTKPKRRKEQRSEKEDNNLLWWLALILLAITLGVFIGYKI